MDELLKEIIEHTIIECNEQLSYYEGVALENPIKTRLMQQIYMEKLKQEKILYDIYCNEFGDDLHIHGHKLEKFPDLEEMIIEEVGYINNLQTIYNQMNESKWEKTMINILLIQQQIIFRLFTLKNIE